MRAKDAWRDALAAGAHRIAQLVAPFLRSDASPKPRRDRHAFEGSVRHYESARGGMKAAKGQTSTKRKQFLARREW